MMLAIRMGRTLGELCESMSSAEFSLWVEAYRDDQWGDQWDDWRAGMIASTIANFAGKELIKGKSVEPSDFMPEFSKPQEAEPDPVAFFTAVANGEKFNQGPRNAITEH